MTGKRNLVFVEGLPASGKSSLSQLINVSQPESRWFHELQPDSPLYVLLDEVPGNKFRWRELNEAFVNLKVDKSLVFDSRLWLNVIFPALLYGEGKSTILESISANLNAVLSANPRVILLKNGDVKTDGLKAIYKRNPDPHYFLRRLEVSEYGKRLKSWDIVGEAAMVHFWSEVYGFMELAYDALNCEKIKIDVSRHPWESVEKTAFDFLGLKHKTQNDQLYAKEYLSRYSGFFVNRKGENIEISEAGNCLNIVGFKGSKFPWDR
ncbi:MAG: hypothetical protein JNM63_07810, partial [Spirochaetia bacterium]|nr:hypothetical protein [Spirochaetia bacterium]